MEKQQTSADELPVKFTWKRTYSLLLLLNAVYILLFYYLTRWVKLDKTKKDIG